VSARRWLAVTVAFLLVAAAVIVLAGSQAGSRGSTVSRGPGGWLLARRYLAARGARITLITVPLARYLESPPAEPGRAAGAGVLVLAFPWQGVPTADLDELIATHLRRGGDLVLAYSGDGTAAERLVGLWRWPAPRPVPLVPWRWWAFVRREWQLLPAAASRQGHPAPGAATAVTAPSAAGRRPLRIWRPRLLPGLAPGARVLYASPAGGPAVAVLAVHGRRVVVLPADALANARLEQPGNADLLETLLQSLGRRWAFDEYHHGLVTEEGGRPELGRAADLLLAHLLVLYLLAALVLARRQGPAWQPAAPLGGSTASFLRGLGTLHHRLGHHREAALLLVRRAGELDPALALPAALERQAAAVAGPAELVAIAREVARRRARNYTDAPHTGETR
jgi:hypothetical protein